MKIKVIVLVFSLIAVFCPIFLVIYGHVNHLAKVDVAVVFGNKVNTDGTPSNRLKARLDKCSSLYNQGYFKKIIVSGGIGREGYDEADVMKKYLQENGIPEDEIIKDNNGKNTYKTARFTRDYIQNNNLKSIMIITQYFHVYRVKLAMKKVGIKEIYNAYADFYEPMDVLSVIRECLGVIKYSIVY